MDQDKAQIIYEIIQGLRPRDFKAAMESGYSPEEIVDACNEIARLAKLEPVLSVDDLL